MNQEHYASDIESSPATGASPSRVALVRCGDYEQATVDEAVGRGLELLGGLEPYVRTGEHILLKPNLLVGASPEGLVSGHPTVFRAVAQQLRAAGAELSYGDSPAFGGAAGAARKAGIAAVAEELGIRLADLSNGRTVSFSEGRLIKQFTIADAVLDADGIVSLPKLKTHGLMRITGAVKNQFGCIPGLLKGEFHARMNTMDRFGQMLVDLNRLVRPRLFIMDGVIAMQGNGPRGGDARPMSVLLFSTDPVAMDATVCRMIALDPMLVPTVRFGEAWGLGQAADVEIVGDPLSSFVDRDFVVNRAPGSTTGESGRFSRFTRDRLVPRPVIDPSLCTACGTCVKMCPVEPKAVDFEDGYEWVDESEDRSTGTAEGAPVRARHHPSPPVHRYDRCIRCYCCQELCPEHAIGIAKPLLGRLIHR
jgi:uncharacterized protein (DUF362 family)/ferredoxin